MSAAVSTFVASVTVLSAGSGSGVDEVTVAVFSSTASAGSDGSTMTVRYTVTDAPGAIVPSSQTTVPGCTSAHTVPPLPSTPSTNVVPSGSSSVISTSFAVDGPPFVTSIV